MRHSFAFRMLSALLGVLVLFNLAQPKGMSGMDMRGMGMGGMDMPPMGASVSGETTHAMGADGSMAHHTAAAKANDAAAHCDAMAAASHDASAAKEDADGQSSAPAGSQDECQQHECCTSALVHAALAPVTTLSWLPEHVISKETPSHGDCVVDTDGQLLLPFANGPPRTVIA